MIKLGKLEIPKSEEDVKRISEEIEESMHQHHPGEGEDSASNAEAIAHQLEHVQDLLIHVIRGIKEIRDSIDNLSSIVRKNMKVVALGYILLSVENREIKKKIAELIIKDMGLDISIE
ncbi:MAG: hypothetical protein N3D82_01900 [Ignisphaera sp.]|nr:hypothetical protein [Ignisphaera sp.]MCX8167773.1 hypothetical protein [Ignisphaera sp.]MDW8085240.1 hypothetical protein [Ignisphaera sp.]